MYVRIKDRLEKLQAELEQKRHNVRERERQHRLSRKHDITRLDGNSYCVFHIEDSTGYVLYVGKGTVTYARRIIGETRRGNILKRLGRAIEMIEASDLQVYIVIDHAPVTPKDAEKKKHALIDIYRDTVIMPHIMRYPPTKILDGRAMWHGDSDGDSDGDTDRDSDTV